MAGQVIQQSIQRVGLAASLLVVLGACSSVPIQSPSSSPNASSSSISGPSGPVRSIKQYENWERAPQGSGYYLDDGPGSHRPAGLHALPDARPVVEPIAKANTRPYTVMGLSFTPQQTLEEPYRQKGKASWYGRKFHGAKTANGEIYDMYQMTAAHPTLPLPSYARVTNLRNNKQVIVRVNDRGPFLRGRIMDLSYAAALKLDYINQGHADVLVEKLTPDLIAQMNRNQPAESPTQAADTSNAAIVQATPVGRVPQTSEMAGDRRVVERNAQSEPLAESDLIGKASPIESQDLSAQPLKASLDPEMEKASPVQAVQPDLATSVFLQLGAFGQQTNATSMATRLRKDYPDLASVIEVIDQRGLYRVMAGPFATQEAANEAAIGLSAAAGVTPIVKEDLILP